MSRCSIRRIAFALAALAAAPAAAQQWRTSVTPGATLHAPSERWDDDDATSWPEQWEWVANEDDAVPWFLDLLHAELGWLRGDDTWLFHVERWSPYAWGERTLLDADWRGLRVGGEAHRFRTGDLRLTPVGTGDTGVAVNRALGSRFNDDTDPDDSFFVRRYGGGGEIRLRPDDFGWSAGPLSQLSFFGSQELRTGRRQDRYLLRGPTSADWRFRGRTRDLDQEVTTLGGRLVAVPFGLATSVVDVSWQRFREHEPAALVADVAAVDPAVRPSAGDLDRTILFVPDTNRVAGTLRVSRRFGEATLHGGAYASKLSQTGSRTPQQRAAGLRGNDVTHFAAHAAADVPLTDWLGFDAFGKAAFRNNGLPRDTDLFADDNRTQIAPFLRQLRDVRGGAELVATPMPGARVAAGWRVRDVDRDLEYPQLLASDGLAQRAITPEVSLVRGDTTQHATYLRGHARLLRRTRVSGEAGIEWAPAIGMPTELEQAAYAEARLSHGVRAPVPLTVSVFGHWRNGSSDGFELESRFAGRSQDKDYERRTADWGASITAMPRDATTLYATFTQQWDRRRFPYVRSNVPRANGAAFVRFFLDSEVGWQSDVRVLAIGGTQRLSRTLDVSLGGWLTWADGRFPRGGATADALDVPNEIDIAYASAEAALGFQLRPDLRLGLAYRFDRYRDDARIDEPNVDGHDHAVTLSATYEFAFPSRPRGPAGDRP